MNSVQAYPSPAKGDTVWFYFSGKDVTKVTIAIYNVAGEQVVVLNETPQWLQGNYYRTSWNIRNVAPGIYLYRLRLENPVGAKELRNQRLVIVK